jgi:hypothetical protein
LIERPQLHETRFDGCALSRANSFGRNQGVRIVKPWRVAIDCFDLFAALTPLRCPGKQVHLAHVPREGRDVKVAEECTREVVDIISFPFGNFRKSGKRVSMRRRLDCTQPLSEKPSLVRHLLPLLTLPLASSKILPWVPMLRPTMSLVMIATIMEMTSLLLGVVCCV